MASIYTEIRLQGEIERLKAKCRHASEVARTLDGTIRDSDFTDKEQLEHARDVADALKMYLAEC